MFINFAWNCSNFHKNKVDSLAEHAHNVIQPSIFTDFPASRLDSGIFQRYRENVHLLDLYCTFFQLLPECKYKKTTVDLTVGEEKFKWSGSTLVSAGYTSVYTWHALEDDESAGTVRFEKGQVWEVEQVRWCVQS